MKEKSQQFLQKHKGIIRGYYKQLHDNKIGNLEEINKFLKT